MRVSSEALPVAITIDVPQTLPPLPAAVEVAAYRIATEALTNIARHARATSAHVELTIGSAVRLSIMDNGAAHGPWTAGVGLTSIRERAAEFGGSL
jgi:two-component system NarL family sensor kinase